MTKIWNDGGRVIGNEWHYGSFGFYTDSPYLIQITGTNGGSVGSIAIDDIIFQEAEYCAVFPFNANTGGYLPAPDPVIPVMPANETSEYDCDFEKNFCKWKRDLTYRMTWVRENAVYQSSESGPSVDHTLGTKFGYFAHIGLFCLQLN